MQETVIGDEELDAFCADAKAAYMALLDEGEDVLFFCPLLAMIGHEITKEDYTRHYERKFGRLL